VLDALFASFVLLPEGVGKRRYGDGAGHPLPGLLDAVGGDGGDSQMLLYMGDTRRNPPEPGQANIGGDLATGRHWRRTSPPPSPQCGQGRCPSGKATPIQPAGASSL